MTHSEPPQQSTSLTVEQAFTRAVAHHQAGQLQDAERLYRAILSAQPDHVSAHNNLGAVGIQVAADAFAAGRHAEAAVLAKSLTSQYPAHSFGWKLLGSIHSQAGRHQEALAALRQAEKLLPPDAEVHRNLGIVLNDIGHLDAAISSCHRALEISPDSVEAHNTLGGIFNRLGKFDDALSIFRHALKIDPNSETATWNLALTLLAVGQYNEGWRRNEIRSVLKEKKLVIEPGFSFPLWEGQPLVGRSIVIVEEQGIGDDLQFFRYASTLKEMGATHVTLLCKDRLRPLFSRIKGVDSVIERKGVATVAPRDFWVFAQSLPLHCGTTVDSVPADIPYLFADTALTDRVAGELGPSADLKIGICWRGNPTYISDSERSPGLDFFKPIFGIDGTRIYTLLPNSRAELSAIAGGNVVDIGHELDESTAPFAETAALIMNLDLVITCDTSIGHLAGALGKPVWLVIPYAAHWVWMTGREDSPWYPNTRLFRQTARGNWADVFERVTQKIRAVLAGGMPLVWPVK